MPNQPILVVAGTNHPNSLTSALAHHYAEILKNKSASAQVLELASLPPDFMASALHDNCGKVNAFNQAKSQMEQAQKYIFIVPDYNASFPGVLKAFIDKLEFPKTFAGKKCALVGISKGYRGGSFALSHLTDIFHYLRMHVYPLNLTLSRISDSKLETILANPNYAQLLEEQAEGIINF
ncbi:MAG: NADPH-dependent FMN reductase [Candidatus Amoebophilus sp.]